MSVTLMGKVFDLNIPTVEKFVLVALADHARDDGTGAYPSVERLTKKTSLSRRGVQKILRRLEQERLIVPTGKVTGGRASTVEYKITLDAGKGEPGSLFPTTKGRTPEPKRANLSARKGEPGSPEPSLAVKEASRQSAKDRQTDPRFQKIVDEFFRLSRAKSIEPAFDRSDGNQLKAYLARQPNTPAEKILATLANAFASTDPYPLRPGFRLREFVAHESKYQLGPMHKPGNGNGNSNGTGKAGPEPLRRPKVTKEGLEIYKQYGINPEWMQ